MLLAQAPGRRIPRLTVMAYDMASPRRARRVRRILESVHHARQYSVFESLMHTGEFRGLLAEVTECCDLSEDKLAAWWPREGVRVLWERKHPRIHAPGRGSAPAADTAASVKGAGNFMVCYDISDDGARDAVAGKIAAEGAMVQRSVYWLRVPSGRLMAVLEGCGPYLQRRDRLWAYPLRGAHDLWRVGPEGPSVLPMAAHRWPGYAR